MRHAILGAGAVGGLVGAALAHSGEQVTLLLRPETLRRHPGRLRLERPAGEIEAKVECAAVLAPPVDVLWIAVKAIHLAEALAAAPAPALHDARVVPLLNGIGHVSLLRAVYGRQNVVPGAIAVESELAEPGRIIQKSQFARLMLAASGETQLAGVAARLRGEGLTCDFISDEATLLWGKLVFLGPFALVTAASDKDKGAIWADSGWRQKLEAAVHEACAVALAEGARVDETRVRAGFEALPGFMRTSMQKDVAAGKPPELEAIGGPIVQAAARHRIAIPVTLEMMEIIRRRSSG